MRFYGKLGVRRAARHIVDDVNLRAIPWLSLPYQSLGPAERQIGETGTAFIVLHHAGKPKEGHADARTALRGSSAVFDAAGCVLLLTNGQGKDAPRHVQQTKTPADAEGAGLDPFGLRIEDVPGGEGDAQGVRVVVATIEAPAEVDQFEERAERMIELVKENPGRSQRWLRANAGFGASAADDILACLTEDGRLVSLDGPRKAKFYRVAVHHDA